MPQAPWSDHGNRRWWLGRVFRRIRLDSRPCCREPTASTFWAVMRLVGLLLALGPLVATATATATAHAEPCTGNPNGIGCFDALPDSGPAEPSPLHGLGWSHPLGTGKLALTAGALSGFEPVVVDVPSPDPAGKRVVPLRFSERALLRFGWGLARQIDLTANLGAAVWQRGAGPDALASQTSDPVAPLALVDPRLGLRAALPSSNRHLAWMMRGEVSAPFGSARAYAGNLGPTMTLALSSSYQLGRWFFLGELGALARKPVRIGDLNVGRAALLGVGLGRAFFADQRLTLGAELQLRPTLVSGAAASGAAWTANVPAEWLATATYRLAVAAHPWTISASGGGGLPLSSRTESAPMADAHYLAPTAARIRAWLGIATVFELAPHAR